jgi:hypothetical protein
MMMMMMMMVVVVVQNGYPGQEQYAEQRDVSLDPPSLEC